MPLIAKDIIARGGAGDSCTCDNKESFSARARNVTVITANPAVVVGGMSYSGSA